MAFTGLFLGTGCSSSKLVDRYDPAFARIYTPQVPEFLSGPAGALLTNTAGFSARARFESHTGLGPVGPEITEGELLARGTQLLFAPRKAENAPKELESAGFMFMWDVANARGYIASETLQAYAPVSSTVKPDGVVIEPAGEKDQENAVVHLNNGSSWLLKLRGTVSGKGVPSGIASVTNAPSFSIKLTKIRLEPPSADLFSPPEGFSKYATAEALADELAARKNGLRRGAWSRWERSLQNMNGAQ